MTGVAHASSSLDRKLKMQTHEGDEKGVLIHVLKLKDVC